MIGTVIGRSGIRTPLRPLSRVSSLVAVAAIVVLVAACSSSPASPSSFDPTRPCGGADEQRMAGAYPELEALLPTTLAGVPPTTRDSGRMCSKTTLGTVFDAGITEVHFAGETWDRGSGKAVSLVLFDAPGLTAGTMFASYEAGAANNQNVHDPSKDTVTIDGLPGQRLDFANGESFQTIVVWPAAQSNRVRVVLTADLLNVDVQAAIDVFK